MTDELVLLQAMKLKGRLTPPVAELFAARAESASGDAWASVSQLGQAGLADVGATAARLTPAGRDRLQLLIVAEREAADAALLRELYAQFDQHNSSVKATVASWQVRPDGSPNDHSNAAYDAAVVARLADCHAAAAPLLSRIVDAAPRLAHYPPRFDTALSRAQAGEARAVAHPLDDSYHQIWFELHEDLLGLLGLSREAEALAGRAE